MRASAIRASVCFANPQAEFGEAFFQDAFQVSAPGVVELFLDAVDFDLPSGSQLLAGGFAGVV